MLLIRFILNNNIYDNPSFNCYKYFIPENMEVIQNVVDRL